MASILVQGGSSLYKVDPSTGTATALTLPSGITLSTEHRPRFATLNQFVIMTNSPSRNLCIDPEGNVRVLVPRQPPSPPYIQTSGTGITGSNYRMRVSFIVRDTVGNIMMESALSPVSNALTLSNQGIAASNVPVSEDSISARRIYRNASTGTQYYFLQDLEGNTSTSFVNALVDASLTLLPTMASTLTSPPGTLSSSRMRNIVAWKNRLWGTGDNPDDVDRVFYSEDGKIYAWPNVLTASPKGQDAEGVVAFAPRKDQLGVLKRNGLWQITGTSSANFAIVQITVEQGRGGCVAPESVVVINDRAYWLGKDGVYEWGPEGVRCISDEKVPKWFKSDTIFNRSRFPNAFARYNPRTTSYELHLAAAGSSSEDRWVSFNVTNRAWYGPHKTAAFTPSCAGQGEDSNGLPIVLVGGTDGVLYTANSSTYRDGSASAIDFDCYGPWHSGDAPDINHTFGQLSVLSKIQSTGNLSIYPQVGKLNAPSQAAILHDMTKGRELLRRLGEGDMARLRFRQNVVDQGVVLYGYELPIFENGRR